MAHYHWFLSSPQIVASPPFTAPKLNTWRWPVYFSKTSRKGCVVILRHKGELCETALSIKLWERENHRTVWVTANSNFAGIPWMMQLLVWVGRLEWWKHGGTVPFFPSVRTRYLSWPVQWMVKLLRILWFTHSTRRPPHLFECITSLLWNFHYTLFQQNQ